MVSEHISLQQQNVKWSGSHIQASQILLLTPTVLLLESRRSQARWEPSNLLPNAASAFSGALNRTESCGCAFKMPRYLTARIVKFWRGWDVCTGLWESSRAAEMFCAGCRRHREQLTRTLHSSAGGSKLREGSSQQ